MSVWVLAVLHALAVAQPLSRVHATLSDAEAGHKLYDFALDKQEQGPAAEWTSTYTDVQGKVFAQETTRMLAGELQSYHLALPQQAEQARITIAHGQTVFEYTRSGSTKTATERHEKNTIVGTQLVSLIQNHWDTLLKGGEVPVRYIVPDRLETLGFHLRHVAGGSPGNVLVEFRPSNFFIRQVVDPIRVTLDSLTHKALRIEGRSFLKKKTPAGDWTTLISLMRFEP